MTHRARRALLALALCTLPATVAAQHGGSAGPPPPVAPKEGAQFDFLIGQWELVGQPLATTLAQRLHGVGKLPGTWKAWRALEGWGLEDELRLTDPSGNPVLYSHTVRYYDSAARRWSLSAVDVYKGISSTPTAEWRNGEMIVSGAGKDADGRAYISRGTFSKITPTSFTYRLDRSYDNGKKWTEGITRIDAKRVAATAPR
jgi:hypothetical protein